MIRVNAESLAATLFYQMTIRYRADESVVAGGLSADHFCTAIGLRFHYAPVAAIRNLPLPNPAIAVVRLLRHRV
jgi:hypothetical protein